MRFHVTPSRPTTLIAIGRGRQSAQTLMRHVKRRLVIVANLQPSSKWTQATTHLVESTSTQPVAQGLKYVRGLRVLQVVLILVGLILVALSAVIPVWMGAMIRGGGESAAIRSGYLRALTPFITTVSMASSLIVAAVILSFEKLKANVTSVLFGILTLSVFTIEISLSIYLSVVRPLSGTAPTQLAIYALIGLVLLGLGCTMFTLASIISP